MIAVRLTFGVGFVLASLSLAAAQAPEVLPVPLEPMNVSASSIIEDYINENWRQYNATIANFTAQMDAQKATFQAQLRVFDLQNQLTELKLQDTIQNLRPKALLSPINKHCVQKTIELMPNAESLAQLKQCVQSAKGAEGSIFYKIKGQVDTLSSYYKNTLQKGLNVCAQNFTEIEYSDCVANVTNAANIFTAEARKKFAKEIWNLQPEIEQRIAQAVDCADTHTFNITAIIGQAEALVEKCALDTVQQPCEQFCPHAINLSSNLIGINNQTIQNPFYGLDKQINDCVLVNFDPDVQRNQSLI